MKTFFHPTPPTIFVGYRAVVISTIFLQIHYNTVVTVDYSTTLSIALIFYNSIIKATVCEKKMFYRNHDSLVA